MVLLSSIGASYANDTNNDTVVYPIDPALLYSGSLTIQIDPTTVHVNDTIEIIVTATNSGLVDWGQLKIFMPVPAGTQYVSFVVPNRNLQYYDPTTGIWNVVQMKHFERGQQKTAILTVKVLPSAAGKTLKATASFNSLILEGYNVDMAGQVADARAYTITVAANSNSSGNNGNNGNGKNGNNGNGSNGNNSDGKNGNNSDGKSPDPLINTNGASQIVPDINNFTNSNANGPLTAQSGGGGGGKKSYDISQIPPISKNDLLSYLIAALVIIGMIVAGYYYGIKNED